MIYIQVVLFYIFVGPIAHAVYLAIEDFLVYYCRDHLLSLWDIGSLRIITISILPNNRSVIFEKIDMKIDESLQHIKRFTIIITNMHGDWWAVNIYMHINVPCKFLTAKKNWLF